MCMEPPRSYLPSVHPSLDQRLHQALDGGVVVINLSKKFETMIEWVGGKVSVMGRGYNAYSVSLEAKRRNTNWD